MAESLTDRLDDLMARLHQEGRVEDAAIVLEAIRALTPAETAAGWPTGHEMIRQFREALGLFAGAMPISPQQAWEEALDEARRLKEAGRG